MVPLLSNSVKDARDRFAAPACNVQLCTVVNVLCQFGCCWYASDPQATEEICFACAQNFVKMKESSKCPKIKSKPIKSQKRLRGYMDSVKLCAGADKFNRPRATDEAERLC